MDKVKVVFTGGSLGGQRVLEDLVVHPYVELVGTIPNNGDKTTSWYNSIQEISEEHRLRVLGRDYISEIEVPDVLISVLSERILKEPVLSWPKHGCLNIHYALLPKHGGRFPLVHAILEGDESAGVTMHAMNSGIDTGKILYQDSFPIEDYDTAHSLYHKATGSARMLVKKSIGQLDQLKDGESLYFKKQVGESSYHDKKSLPSDCIDLSWDNEKINRYARAFHFPPFPSAYIEIKGQKFDITPRKK